MHSVWYWVSPSPYPAHFAFVTFSGHFGLMLPSLVGMYKWHRKCILLWAKDWTTLFPNTCQVPQQVSFPQNLSIITTHVYKDPSVTMHFPFFWPGSAQQAFCAGTDTHPFLTFFPLPSHSEYLSCNRPLAWIQRSLWLGLQLYFPSGYKPSQRTTNKKLWRSRESRVTGTG